MGGNKGGGQKTRHDFASKKLFSPEKDAENKGQNEKGLAIGMLYLPGFAQNLHPEAAPADKSIGSWEVLNYLPANCSSVDQAVSALQNDVYVAQ